jgi:hypothetical protein
MSSMSADVHNMRSSLNLIDTNKRIGYGYEKE